MCTGSHPFIPVPNTAQVQLVYDVVGQRIENVHYFQQATPFSEEDLGGLIGFVETAWDATISTNMPTAAHLVAIIATALDSEDGAQVEVAEDRNGSASGTLAPLNVTLAIKFTTGKRGRSYRGRMYWPATSNSYLSGNQYLAPQAEDMRGSVQAFFETIVSDAAVDHVVVSYCQDGVWNSTGITTTVLNYVLTDIDVDSQRRRLTGRGT